MVCSHCSQSGHTYRKCPTITPEEKIVKQNHIKAKKEKANERRNKRVLETNLTSYEITNITNYDMVLYWGYSKCHIGTDNIIYRFDYLEAHSSTTIKCIKTKHIIVAFPFLEVQHNDSVNALINIPFECRISNNHESIIFPYQSVINLKMKNFEGDHIIIDSDYKPKKTEIDMWRECALKSKFLLDQIYQMTGGGKTKQEYENIEVFMDMVEDISVPKCTEYEKEIAGVPSLLTNIT